MNDKKYTTRGNIPDKFILRPIKKSNFRQNYFCTGGILAKDCKENEDFDSLNNLYENHSLYSILSIKNNIQKDDIVLDNIPVKLKVIGIFNQSYKQNGSNSIIKVLMPQGYAVQMPSDILFESLYKSGCDVNGDLRDEFLIASNGKTLTFTRENSGLHLSCLSHMEQMSKPKMTKMSFDAGSIYQTSSGAEALFLGYVTTLVPKINLEFNNEANRDYSIKSANFEFTNVKTATLWFPFSYYTIYNRSLSDAFNSEMKSDHFISSLKLVSGNSHSFVNKSSREPISINNPTQIIYSAVTSAEKYANKNIALFQSQTGVQPIAPHSQRMYPLRWYQVDNVSRYGKYLNLEIFGLKAKKHNLLNEIEKTWFPKFIMEHNRSGDTRRKP